MKKLFILGMSSMFALGASAQTLEERVEALEFASYEDIFKFSGQVEMQYDSTTEKDNDADTEETDQDWKIWAKLNMNSQPTDKLSFFGRLSMGKDTNRMSQANETFYVGQLGEGQDGAADSEVYVERFFVNYSFTKGTTFTFGRLPSANGSPYHLTRDEALGGSYPYLSYNAFFDGWAVTQSITDDLVFRFIHTPFSFTDGNTTTSGEEVEDITDIWSVMLEYDKNNVGFARRLNVVLHYLSAKNVVLDLNDLDNAGNDSGTQSDLAFSIDRAVLAIEANGIAGSKWDMAFQTMSIAFSNNGAFLIPDGVGGTTETSFVTDGSEENGTVHILTARYALSDSQKFGFQYSEGSQYSFTSDLVSKTPISIAVPGKGYHLFYNHTFTGGLKANLGYMKNEIEYAAPINNAFGERAEVDQENQSVYLSFVANF